VISVVAFGATVAECSKVALEFVTTTAKLLFDITFCVFVVGFRELQMVLV